MSTGFVCLVRKKKNMIKIIAEYYDKEKTRLSKIMTIKKEGLAHGWMRWYYPNGDLAREIFFENGRISKLNKQ